MTEQQASNIQQHLIEELNRYGFGDRVQDALQYLEEASSEDYYSEQTRYDGQLQSPQGYLLRFLEQIIYSIDQISNKSYNSLLERLNVHLSNDGRPVIETLEVELAGPEPSRFDLRYLPSYAPLVNELGSIYQILIISEENRQK